MTLPGPNRTLRIERRLHSLRYERPGAPRPLASRSIVQALAAGLQIDPAARAAGFADGSAGRDWDPRSHDIFSYSAGYAVGQSIAPKRGGGHGAPSQ